MKVIDIVRPTDEEFHPNFALPLVGIHPVFSMIWHGVAQAFASVEWESAAD